MILNLTNNPKSDDGIILKTGELLVSQSGFHFRIADGFPKIFKTLNEFRSCDAQIEIIPQETRKENNGFNLEVYLPKIGLFYARVGSITETLKFIWFQFLNGIGSTKSLKVESVFAFATLGSLATIKTPPVNQLNEVKRKATIFIGHIALFVFYASLSAAIRKLDLFVVLFFYLKQLFFN